MNSEVYDGFFVRFHGGNGNRENCDVMESGEEKAFSAGGTSEAFRELRNHQISEEINGLL